MPTAATTNFILVAVKVAILLILIFYAIFALIIIRQVDLMAKTFVTGISPIFRTFSVIHAIFAIVLVLLAAGVL